MLVQSVLTIIGQRGVRNSEEEVDPDRMESAAGSVDSVHTFSIASQHTLYSIAAPTADDGGRGATA